VEVFLYFPFGFFFHTTQVCVRSLTSHDVVALPLLSEPIYYYNNALLFDFLFFFHVRTPWTHRHFLNKRPSDGLAQPLYCVRSNYNSTIFSSVKMTEKNILITSENVQKKLCRHNTETTTYRIILLNGRNKSSVWGKVIEPFL
jgi:hypothetical protein